MYWKNYLGKSLLNVLAPASLSLRFFVALRERFIFAVVYYVMFCKLCVQRGFFMSFGRIAARAPRVVPSLAGRRARARAARACLHFKSRDILFIGSRDVRQMNPPTPSTTLVLGLVGCASRYLMFVDVSNQLLAYLVGTTSQYCTYDDDKISWS